MRGESCIAPLLFIVCHFAFFVKKIIHCRVGSKNYASSGAGDVVVATFSEYFFHIYKNTLLKEHVEVFLRGDVYLL